MVFQHFGLFPHRRVIDNVAYGLEVQRVPKAARREQAAAVLETVGLGPWANHYPQQLSGGMQQRVGLARALVLDPQVLFFDEPFSALDPLIRRDMQDELCAMQLRRPRTMVFITHDFDEALRLGDRIAIMKDGVLDQVGTPEEVVAEPATSYVREFTTHVPQAEVLTARRVMGAVRDCDRHTTASATIAELIPMLLSDPSPIAVHDDDGEAVGSVDAADVAALLAPRPFAQAVMPSDHDCRRPLDPAAPRLHPPVAGRSAGSVRRPRRRACAASAASPTTGTSTSPTRSTSSIAGCATTSAPIRCSSTSSNPSATSSTGRWRPWPSSCRRCRGSPCRSIVVVLIGRSGHWFTAVAAAVAIALPGMFGLWQPTMETLALMLVAVAISVLIGVPLGVAAGLNRRFYAFLRPVLDAMQTVPSTAFLVPAVLFFGIGPVPAAVATVIYAMAPVVRLTALGIRQVPIETVEAGHVFGSTRRQLLFKVQLPQSVPSIMTGVNQTINMALGIIVIAALVGAGGLGQEALETLRLRSPGRGLVVGVAIVAVAVMLDRVSRSFIDRRQADGWGGAAQPPVARRRGRCAGRRRRRPAGGVDRVPRRLGGDLGRLGQRCRRLGARPLAEPDEVAQRVPRPRRPRTHLVVARAVRRLARAGRRCGGWSGTPSAVGGWRCSAALPSRRSASSACGRRRWRRS